ncbi:MAG: hypothetical protein DMD95_01175 [Candidatus Rokuibacteriota bacterium]|nr:MAG: hypothetical protein DMD95_01175 [Candidatus Rokubacteria bacterium]
MTRREVARATIPATIAGTEVGALSTSLDARWLMAYAAALGLDDTRYYDTLAPAGPVAHPLFSVCYEWPAVVALRAKTVREAWVLLGVHATHHVIIHRPPTADDRLLTRAQIVKIRPSRAGVPIAAHAAHVYSECARIWNPIHTDVAVARTAGLTAPILHGSATLALAVSQVIQHDLDGDPARVREIAARFTGLVFMPSTFTVRGRGRVGDLFAFEAVDERGELVLSDGVIRA